MKKSKVELKLGKLEVHINRILVHRFVKLIINAISRIRSTILINILFCPLQV